MNPTIPQGLGVALVTPFTDDNRIDFPTLKNLIERQIRNGVDFIVALGTTAETPTLTLDERIEIQHFIADTVADRIPLIIGKGGNCTAAVVEELSHGNLDGYSAILSVAPFYNKPSQQGLISHFTEIADHSPLPVVLYNVPSRTGVNLSADTTVALAAHPNIVAIKEASGNIAQAAEILRRAPRNFKVFSGDDALTLPLMSLGACGVISVVANAMTAEFSRMVNSILRSDIDSAARIHHTLSPLLKLMFADGNPAGIKALLNIMGLCNNRLRLPLTPASENTMLNLRKFIDTYSPDLQ